MVVLIQIIPYLLLLANSVTARPGKPMRQVVEPDLYHSMLKYAGFVEASSKHPCAKPPNGAAVVQELNIASSDIQASIYRLDSSNEFIVAIPGTKSIENLLTDVETIPLPYDSTKNCSNCLVHSGFALAFSSILEPLERTLSMAVQEYPKYTITIAGYSLGGALAKLAFVYFKDSSVFGQKVTAGWTYGEPRVGNIFFAEYSDKLAGANDQDVGIYHRVTHANDIIPHVPLLSTGFWHSHTEIWADNDKQIGVPGPTTTYRCFGAEPLDCNNAKQGVDGMIAHLSYPGLNDAPVCE